jgi:hypothetical protein
LRSTILLEAISARARRQPVQTQPHQQTSQGELGQARDYPDYGEPDQSAGQTRRSGGNRPHDFTQ